MKDLGKTVYLTADRAHWLLSAARVRADGEPAHGGRQNVAPGVSPGCTGRN